MYDARHVRPRWEVEALLLSAVAEAEARRRSYEDERSTPVIENRVGEPAPAWVDALPT
jgi:hypothetical protein